MVNVGFTLTKDKINIVQLKGSKKKLALIKTYTIPSTTPPLEIVSEIKRFFKKNNIKTKYIGVNLSRRQILASIIELPPLKKELITQALKYEIEAHIPYPIEEVYYDYQILSQEGKKTNILLVAVRKEVVEPYLQFLSQLSLIPLFVDVDSFGVINLCLELFANEFKHHCVLLISSCSECNEISLFKNEKLQFTKSLPHRLSETEFLEEIKKIIDYFQIAPLEFKIDKIILTEGISLNNITQKLKEALGIPCISINPVVSLTGKEKTNLEELNTISAGFRGIKQGRLKIDLSPRKEILTQEVRKKNYKKTGMLLILIFILTNAIFYVNLMAKEKQLHTLKATMQKNQSLINNIMGQKEQLLKLQEELKLLQGINKEKEVEFLDLLCELTNILPSNVWIRHITFEKDRLKELKGTTLDSASSLLAILDASPYFEQVEFIGSIVKNQEIEEFSLKAKITK